jgi:hypothetical protein
LCSFQIDQTLFLLSPQPSPLLAYFCSRPNSPKSASAPPFVCSGSLAPKHPSSALRPSRPSSAASPQPTLPRPLPLTGGTTVSSPSSRSSPSQTRVRTRARLRLRRTRLPRRRPHAKADPRPI